MHDETRIVVRKVGVLPAHIHQTPVVHHSRMPVGILIERHAAQLSGRRLIGYHVANLVGTVHARHTLITYVAHGDDTSAGHVGSVEELQIRLVDLNGLVQPSSVAAYLVDAPAVVFIGSGEEDALAVPVQQQVGH